MNYQVFYAEVTEWIEQCNQQAKQHSINSVEFWNWVASSLGELCKRHNDHVLAKKQVVLLWDWLEEKTGQ